MAAGGLDRSGYAPPAEAAGDRIRKIVIVSGAQAADPQEFQAAQLIAQEWRKLGLEVEVRGLPRPQVSDIVWYNRDKWDVSMWRMVGRPERSDPDELIYNLFHSSTREKGFNFVGYQNPNYDKIAEAQRSEIDQAKRKVLVHQAQDMIMADVPYLFLVYPKNVVAYSSNVWKKDTIVDQSGIGVRNFWTFIGATPVGQPEGHGAERRRGAQCRQSALHLGRDRQLGDRSRLGPPDARRSGRPAEAVVGRKRHLRRSHDRRGEAARRDRPGTTASR